MSKTSNKLTLTGVAEIQAAKDRNPATTGCGRFALTGVAEIQAAKDGEGKRPTFSIAAYNGGLMDVAGFYMPVIVDLSGLKSSRPKLPILFDHDPARIIGQADEIKIDADGVRLSGVVTGEDEDAQKVVTHAKNGFAWQASIGANIVRREFLEAGKKTTVNGRDITGPTTIVRESTLIETSFVSVGADQTTSVTVAAKFSEMGTDMKFEQWLEAKGVDPAALSDSLKAALKMAYEAENKGQGQPTESLDSILKAKKADQTRVDAITKIAAQALEECPRQVETIEAIARMAIDSGWDTQKADLEILRATRSGGANPFRGRIVDDKITNRVLEAAVCVAGRLQGVEKIFDDATLQAAHDRFPHGISLNQLIMQGAEANGYRSHYSARVTIEAQRAAFNMVSPREIRAQGWSTISIPTTLANTANKFLRMGWEAVDLTPMRIAAIANVSDFKTITTVSLTGDLKFLKVGAGGEIKHGTLGEETYSNKADTYARMLAITRTDIINDDLGALTKIPRLLGRGAALKLNEIFWTEFLDNSTFFTSGNSNVSTVDGTLSLAGLEQANAIFMNQTDPDGNPLGATPRILLVPTALEATARALMTSEALISGSTTPSGNANIWRGRFRVESSPYLSNSNYTGYSAVAWYLLADPNDIPVIEIAALNGRVEPVVETADADFNTLGIQMRGYSDVGVNLQEYRGGVRADGSAA